MAEQPELMPIDDCHRQSIHGDYQQSNVFFDDAGQVCAVIDWDKAEHGHTSSGIVRTMPLTFGLEPPACQAFLTGYRSRRKLTSTDLDDGARRYGAGQLHDTWLYDTVYRDGDDRPRKFIRPGRFVPFDQRWQAVRPALM